MQVQGSPVNDAAASRTDRKRAAILDAAQQVFVAHGYVGASMDKVAARAAVSKQTVYKHFGDKETLFREVVAHVAQIGEGGIPTDRFVSGDEPFPACIRSFARHFLLGVMQPAVLELHRLVIAEAVRFPELGQLFYEMTLRRSTDQLAIALERVASAQELRIEDPVVAAEQLLALVLLMPLQLAMLRGREHELSNPTLAKYADEGVATFLRAYRFDEE